MTSPRYFVFRHLPKFDPRASLFPLVKALGGTVLEFDFFYHAFAKRHWRLGHWAREFGNWYSSSTWNALAPWRDERRFLRAIESGPSIVHFLWGEFASPRSKAPYARKGATVVGTFHCSARRLPSVLNGFDAARRYDYITLMSETQRPFFESQGFPGDRIQTILHGVDTEFFCPSDHPREASDRLRLAVVGDTERDHESAARIFSRLPASAFEIRVKTKAQNWAPYKDISHVELLPRLSGEELRDLYRWADLLVLPLLDCTANNAVLESMACGTPVMVNDVGGVPEYVDRSANIVVAGVDVDEWVDQLVALHRERASLQPRHAAVRRWVEQFHWPTIASAYRTLYAQIAPSA